MLLCMGISGNWRTLVRNFAVRVSWRKLRGWMPTSANRLKAGLVRKSPVMNRIGIVFCYPRDRGQGLKMKTRVVAHSVNFM